MEREDEERLTSTSEHGGEEDGRVQTLEETCRSVTEYLKEGFTRRIYSQDDGPWHCCS
jgi:hypothetical protein